MDQAWKKGRSFIMPTVPYKLSQGHVTSVRTDAKGPVLGAAFAYATAAIAPTMDIANCALLTVPTVLLYGCGYMLRWNAIPRYALW